MIIKDITFNSGEYTVTYVNDTENSNDIKVVKGYVTAHSMDQDFMNSRNILIKGTMKNIKSFGGTEDIVIFPYNFPVEEDDEYINLGIMRYCNCNDCLEDPILSFKIAYSDEQINACEFQYAMQDYLDLLSY